jgi:hypothetical protein
MKVPRQVIIYKASDKRPFRPFMVVLAVTSLAYFAFK